MARRMICHGAVSRCITSDSANGSNCGVCREGTLSAALIEAICESANTRSKLGSRPPSVSSASRACRTEPIGSRSSITLGGPIAGQRALLSPPRSRRGDLDDRVRRGVLELADRDFEIGRRSGFPHLVQRGFEFPRLHRARRRGSAIAIPAAARRGGSDPAAPEHCLRPETARAGGTAAGPDRRCAAAPPRRSRARSCAIVRARRWRRWCLRPVRWRASNSRISSACACGGSCAR